MSVSEQEVRAVSVAQQAASVHIIDNDQYLKACEILKSIKGLRQEIADTFDPIIDKANQAHKEAIAQKKKIEQPLIDVEFNLKSRVGLYLTDQERKRHEEELRLQKLAQEEAERQQLADAALLDEIGETEMANVVLEQKPVVVPVIAPRTVPVVSGVAPRVTYSANVVSLMELVRAVAAGKAPIQCLQPNQIFLNQQARAMKAALNYPGVHVLTDRSVAVRR